MTPIMRHFNLIHTLIFVASLTITGTAHSEVTDPVTTSSIPKATSSSTTKQNKLSLARAERLDELFGELKREPNFGKAKRLASRITINWSSSGSATANALMVWAQHAMRDGRNTDAMELLDQVIVLLPDYAEGWNRRATLHYVMRNYVKSMADIEQTLSLEPRHFGALVGMATILSAIGEDDNALEVYERVLSIYPANRNAQASMIKLMQKLEKSEI
jgi:tetratricopeptide (TPR) repeat protein